MNGRNSSKSFQCGLCDVKTKVAWQCIDCDFYMCEKCKTKIHPKLKNAYEHRILENSEHGIEKMDFKNIKCVKHPGSNCISYCVSCCQVICEQCEANGHSHHTYIGLSEGFKGQADKLKENKKHWQTNLDVLLKKKSILADTLKAENLKHKDTKRKIHAQNAALKNAVDALTEKFIDEVDNLWETMKSSAEKEEKQIALLKKTYESNMSKIDDLVKTKNAGKFFDEVGKFHRNLGKKPVEETKDFQFKPIPTFLPGEITDTNVGVLQNVNTDIQLKVINQYQTEIPRVDYISPNNKESLWITCNSPGILHLVEPNETSLHTKKTIREKVFGMAKTLTDDILLVTGGDSQLKQIPRNKEEVVDTKYSIGTMIPTALHVKDNEEIVIGAMSRGPAFPINGKRAIFVMDKEGIEQNFFERDSHNKRIFTYTENITSTKNGNLCLIDQYHGDGRGRVIILSHSGDILQTYSGHAELNSRDRPFKPVGIVTSPSDKIIVPNLNYHMLHILNSSGHFIAYLNTSDVGILHPYSLAFDDVGQLYIGCTTSVGNSNKAKLFKVKMSS